MLSLENERVKSVTLPSEIRERWKANTGSLGIRLTDEDIERLGQAVGVMHSNLAAILERANGRQVVPDYLANNRQEEVDNG